MSAPDVNRPSPGELLILATSGTQWRVVDGDLVVDGADMEAEEALSAFGGGSQLLLNLYREVGLAVRSIPVEDCDDLLPHLQSAAAILDGSRRALPADVSPLTLWLLVTTRDPGLAALVADHPAVPASVLERLVDSWSPRSTSSGRRRVRVAQDGPAVRVLAAVAGNPSTPQALLAGLARSEMVAVRLAAAGNAATPLPELRLLMVGPAGLVRDAATTTIERMARAAGSVAAQADAAPVEGLGPL